MHNLIRQYFGLVLISLGFSAVSAEPVFVPRPIQVSGNVYAIVGPLGQRSEANAGLNANYGFIVTATGVILIDSGARMLPITHGLPPGH
jgi:hypothetical protein